MKSILSHFSRIPFSNLKKNVLAVFLPILFFCVQSSSLFAQYNSSISCLEDIVQYNEPGTCTAKVVFPDNPDVIDNPDYSVMFSKTSGSPFVVGTTRVIKQLLDQNGYVLQTCIFNVTVVDRDAPVISNCPGDISVSNTKDSCSAIVSFTPPSVFEPCTTQHKDFYYTGAPATFIVPAGVTSIDVDVRGAQGGHTFYNNSVYGNPGRGGLVYATIPVTPGQVLTINVGGAGKDAVASGAGLGGFNGGGNGAAAVDENNVLIAACGGGGGATDIRTGGVSLTNRIIVAGGGGAHGFIQDGGDGGDLEGAHGALAHRYDVNGDNGTYYATGGTQTAGGTGGIYENGNNGGDGSLGMGGNGAAETFAGGGGGGFYGGGGGSFASGAGGSSYIYSTATNVYSIQGGQDGDGFVNFTYTQPAILAQTAGLPSGSSFPVGETINTFTATDAAGNTSACTFKVTVSDNQKPSITAPANVTVNADNQNCAATALNLGTPVTADNCGVASVVNNAPASFSVGTTTVNWTVTDIHGNSSVAIQTVTVTDNQKPVLTVPASQTFNTAVSSYSIPSLVASDNCGIASVSYTISGATTRTGTGTNASGSFNAGTSVITYTVTDIHGNIQTGSTAVTVTAAPVPPINVTIADVYAVSPGGKPNTIYIGYGPSYVTLKATVTGGKSPYTYEWTITGYKNVISRSQTLAVYLPGEYTVTVTDSKGTTGTFKKQVQMIDVRCGNKDDKVIVCVPGKGNKKSSTDCVNDNKVDKILGDGGFLGECSATASASKLIVQEDDQVEAAAITASAAKVNVETADTTVKAVAVQAKPAIIANTINKFSVYPNPASGRFSVQLTNFKASEAEILLLSQNGMTIQKRTVSLTGVNQTITFNTSNLAPGIYLVKVVSEEGTQTAKVILQH